MTEPISRRAFVAAVGGLSLAVVVAACDPGSQSNVELGRLTSVFPDRAAMVSLGRHAIQRREIGDNAATVERDVRPAGASASWLTTTKPDQLRRHLRDAATADFEAGRIVDVAGWNVSLTIARVAALFYLAS
ncbi:MAG: hypothetical protein JJE46_06370 [Acidimicrobiia bacterium]|nr:hypothetical protein [Acidimicrobiia bacterium]